jgi:restriction system protein
MDIVRCRICNVILDDPFSGLLGEQKPCPTCGSVAPLFPPWVPMMRFEDRAAWGTNVSLPTSVLSSVGATEPVAFQDDTPHILLQTVVVRGPKTTEGTLIQAVAVPWFDIIALLEKDPAIAYRISPEKWEEIIAGSYRRAGFDEVILTPRSGDGGRDVIATIRAVGSVRVIDQMKAYKPGHLVTADDVRALYGVVVLDKAAKGFLTTTSDFAPRLTMDPLLADVIPSRIELINGKTLLTNLKKLARGAGA